MRRAAVVLGSLALMVAATACGPGGPTPAPLPTESRGGGSAGPPPAPTLTPPPVPGPTATHTSTRSPGPRPRTVPGRHDYGVCLEGESIIGTAGDDVLRGTEGGDHICGMGGNDTIIGGGGKDKIWGGPGDDRLSGGPMTDFIYGGDGNDVIEGRNNVLAGKGDHGYDFLYGDTPQLAYDDAGNDVIKGGTVSVGEQMTGGPGNDVLLSTPVRAFPHYLDGGEGADVIYALNFSHGGNTDIIDLNGLYDLRIPLGTACSIKTQLTFDPGKDGRTGKVSCTLPWPGPLSRLKDVVDVSASIDRDGKVDVDATPVSATRSPMRRAIRWSRTTTRADRESGGPRAALAILWDICPTSCGRGGVRW